MSFAENLQYLRKKEKITQEDLAEELDVSRQSVSKWETGEAYPETDKIIMLCNKFGVSMDDLVRGEIGELHEDEDDVKCSCQNQGGDSECSCGGEEGGCECSEGECRCDASCACHGEHKHSARDKKIEILSASICSAVMLSCVLIYLLVGFIAHIWHPSWVVFICGALVCVWIGEFTRTDERSKNKTLWQKFAGAISGSVMLAAVIIYLLIGCLANIWHPSWVVFICATVVSAVVGGVTDAVYKSKNTK